MAIPMSTTAQHTLVQVCILFRVDDSFSPCGHRWAQGQAWVSMSTWLSRVAWNLPWEMPSTWRLSGKCPTESGAANPAGDSGVNRCTASLLLGAPFPESLLGPSGKMGRCGEGKASDLLESVHESLGTEDEKNLIPCSFFHKPFVKRK